MGLPELSLQRRAGAWWIAGYSGGDMGPYATRAEADDDRRGVLRFYREGLPPSSTAVPAVRQGVVRDADSQLRLF